jgi:hypothetical protein
MGRVYTERLYSTPTKLNLKTEERSAELSRLMRDASGRLWALGTNTILSSEDGMNWNDFSWHLGAEGSFSATLAVVYRKHTYLFVSVRNGFHLTRFDEFDRRWRHLSEIPIFPFPVVACAVDDEGFTLLTGGKSNSLLYKSKDGLSWTEFPLEFSQGAENAVPVHLQFSSSGVGFGCVYHSVVGEDFSVVNGSSVFGTTDFGKSWRLLASTDSMLLTAAKISDEKLLVGGSDGFLATCDLDGFGGSEQNRRQYSGDVVATDYDNSGAIAVLESERNPIQHSVLLSNDHHNWQQFRLALDERVSGVKWIAASRFILSTSNAIYRCSLSFDSGFKRSEIDRPPGRTLS